MAERAAFVHKYIQSDEAGQYRDKPWALIDALIEHCNQNKVPMLISRAKMDVINDILSKLETPPKVIVEFGAYVGSSAVAWGAMLRDLHGSDVKDLKVYAFEMDTQIAQVARDLVHLAGLDDIVTVMDGPGSDSLKRLHNEGKVRERGVDMVFIDHWEKYYVPDLQLCEQLKLFHKGSIACADNTDYPGAPRYLEYVKNGG